MPQELENCPPAGQAELALPPEVAALEQCPECEQYKRSEDKGYSLRRAWYIGLTTGFCLLVSAALVFLHYDGPLAQQYVTGLLSLAGTVCICYLGAGVVDRQRFLERLGDGFGRHRDHDGDGPDAPK